MRLMRSMQYQAFVVCWLLGSSAYANEGVMKDSAVLFDDGTPYYVQEDTASTNWKTDVRDVLERIDKEEELSQESRQAMERVLRTMPESKEESVPLTERFDIKHGELDPVTAEALAETEQPEPTEPVKIDMTVVDAKPDKVTDAEVLTNQAYDAFHADQMESAIALYKKALLSQPAYPVALYGLATTYQQMGQLTDARDTYTQLLSQDWNKDEVMENFLALVSEEAPKDAIVEIKKLLQKNPSYAPAHAQIALLYARFDDMDKATRHAKEAIRKSPDNLQYRYNLAVMYDQMKHYADAAKLYGDVLTRVRAGKEFIGSLQALENRYTTLSSYLKE